MSSCKLDHSVSDVSKKLSEQKTFLPEILHDHCLQLLNQHPVQQTLNELFHLLKKYDLATPQEKKERNDQIKQLLGQG